MFSVPTPFAIDTYLPSIARDLGSSMELAQLSATAHFAAFALGQPILGPLSDAHGRRISIGIGLVLFAVGSAACIAADRMIARLVARAVQGAEVHGALAT